MPYRTRRRRYSRPRRRKNFTWVRSILTAPGTITDSSIVLFDPLFYARQPPAASGLAELVVPKAATDNSLLPSLDLQDVMIERIFAQFIFSATVGTTTTAYANWTLGITTDSNAVLTTPVETAADTDTDAINPAAYPAIQNVSWMHWNVVHMADPRISSGEIGTGKFWAYYHIDVRSRRRLKDWGDHLAVIANPSSFGDATGIGARLVSSVLLSSTR